MSTFIYLILRKIIKKSSHKIRLDPHKLANKVPNVLIAHSL